ncbi:free fatty acid receptor 4-like [Mercenaria mercenaria]|uniref:free fatty acid receptor 4-like n=1 Tax=Mercenaria mercenaria TaxID=6596 RepID=UPI00234EBC61|nr:free fatty acid receptor 4-like [Mercenaria mercenaria]
MVICGSQINRSYFVAVDTRFGHGNVTYFTYFSEFNRPWRGAAYIEAAVMTTLFVLSGIGNFFILGIMFKTKSSRNITNYFVCNLAIGDILFATAAPFVAYVRITGTWRLGDGMCHLLTYGMFVCAIAMIWTMAVISIDRYLCINRGLVNRVRTVHVVSICLCIWIISACCFLPLAVFFHVKEIEVADDIISICTLLWPKGRIRYSALFMAMLFVFAFLLPMTIITFDYYKIFRKFWSSKRAVGALSHIQSRSQRAAISRRNKDIKMVKTLILLVFVFVIMWLPLFVVLSLLHHDVSYTHNTLPSYGLTWTLIVAYMNPCVNPFLYGFINLEVCQNVLFCCSQCQNSSEELLASNTNLNDKNNTTRP